MFSYLPAFLPLLPPGTLLSSPSGQLFQSRHLGSASAVSGGFSAAGSLVEIVYCQKVKDRSLYYYIQDRKKK